MSTGLIVNNADGDPIISTEEDNQYLWGENYASGGVTYYGTQTLALSSGEANVSTMYAQSNGVVFSGRNKLLFATVPSANVTAAGISGYTNGGLIGLNFKNQKIRTQGVSNHTMTLYLPNVMNNFTGADQGYGLNVYRPNGNVMWSSNCQGHFDILATGTWDGIGNGVGVVQSGNFYTDITIDNALGPFYVLLNGTFLHSNDTNTVTHRRCYEFRYPASGSTFTMRLHNHIAEATNGSSNTSGTSGWSGQTGWSARFTVGYYMIVRIRP